MYIKSKESVYVTRLKLTELPILSDWTIRSRDAPPTPKHTPAKTNSNYLYKYAFE